MPEIIVVKALSPESREEALEIRIKVFVEEQGVDRALEYEFEEESHHFLAYCDGVPAGTSRWRDSGKGIKLERFAVLPQYRKLGVASALLRAVLADAGRQQKIYLHSQDGAVDFYRKHGFCIEGEEFYEAGIRHFRMLLQS